MHGRDPASVYSQRWRWSTVQTAHEGYPLIGISTSSTILSLARYRLGSIKSPIPWRASRWLRLQGRPRAHQSEPAPSILVSSLALLSCIHPTNVPRRRRGRRRRLRQKGEDGGRVGGKGLARRKERTPEGRDTLKENLRKDIEAWYREMRGNILKVLSTLSISNGPVTSGRAEGHLFERNFCSWSSWPSIWFICDVNFFTIFFFGGRGGSGL